ncbi:sensor histidine kinase [Winogradskyella forsetii]|uniref:sensor histidine kinase n=1 Tax=Winogradskyella forsetii TaxID=2686077 RepID=UPI0015BB0C05|nr:ATP-binding protein [Winogradskyella forsetii]
MNANKYSWILYTIIVVIISTIIIQVYWNYKNYQSNKQQLINDVQISLDKAVDDYYADLAEKTTIGFSLSGDSQKNAFKEGSKISNMLSKIDQQNNKFSNLDSLKIENIDGITVFRGRAVDSMNANYEKKNQTISVDSFKAQIKSMKAAVEDSADISSLKILTSKIVVSIKNDTLDLKKVDSLVKEEFKRKNIDVDFYLDYKDPKRNIEYSIEHGVMPELDTHHKSDNYLQTDTKSTFLPKGTFLTILFTNTTKTILNRILGGIVISAFLVLAVISCLFYLLRIIKHQKQLAEVKNDLISNITHEFKTPIATIGVALESMSNFNAIEDKEKTKNYLSMSTDQLTKLNLMVEKLLETATLDSDNLHLNKEQINLVELLNSLVTRYNMQFSEKEFKTNFNVEQLNIEVDPFHFENALNNILDNATKYGGHLICIDLISKLNQTEIHISDNGNTLTKANKDRIFEKFYRIPKGNTHDVKGFGIGLYYTKTIIDKHNGSIDLDLKNHKTNFKIKIPNG